MILTLMVVGGDDTLDKDEDGRGLNSSSSSDSIACRGGTVSASGSKSCSII